MRKKKNEKKEERERRKKNEIKVQTLYTNSNNLVFLYHEYVPFLKIKIKI